MPLRVVFSNRTERLLEAFADALSDEWGRGKRRLFEADRVVAPNVNVSAWLKFGLARHHGIAAHLDVLYLGRFVRELLERGFPGVSVSSQDALRARIFGALADPAVRSREVFAPVRSWLAASGGSSEAEARRCFELAGEVQRLFEEYAWQRPDWVARWPGGPVLAETPYVATEAWKRALWNHLFPDEFARISRGDPPPLVSPHGALRLVMSKPEVAPDVLHVFGNSYLAPAYLELFAALSRKAQVNVYTLNPCSEFWEDVRTPRERRAGFDAESFEGDDRYGLLTDPRDSLPLQLWGRPGREHVRVLAELTQYDHETAFEVPARDSLLHVLQADVIERKADARSPLALTDDGSVRLLACPGLRREAEAVADEVWRFIAERDAAGRPVRFDQVAVVVAGAEPERYFAQLAAAFQESQGLPCSVSDLPFAARGGVSEVVQGLLALPTSRFTRDDVVSLLAHPLVHARTPGVDAGEWRRLADRLGVAFGLDAGDHRGTYLDLEKTPEAARKLPAASLFHWDQALQRLALGVVTGTRAGGEREAVRLGDVDVLPAEPSVTGAGAEAFLLLARSLLADAAFARDARLPMSEWADFLGEFLRSYVVATEDGESADLARCLDAISGLRDLDTGGPVPFVVAQGFAVQALEALSGSRGRWLADGVVVSALQPMRAVPFEAVFVVGLDEARFPRRDVRSRLDLRAAQRRAGDVSGREQDAYLFLETLLCARERLVLSWLAREPTSGEALEPSSVVSDLLRTIDTAAVLPGGAKSLVREVPLRRFDVGRPVDPEAAKDRPARIETPPTQPGARIEARALALRESLDERLAGLPPTDLTTIEEALGPDRFAPVAAVLGVERTAASNLAPAPDDEVLRLSLRDLDGFLRCPMQGHATTMLKLTRDEGEPDPAEDEPVAVDRRDDGVRVRVFMDEVVRTGGVDVTAKVDALFSKEFLEGSLPTGVLGEGERDRLRHVIGTWTTLLAEKWPGHGAARRTTFGRVREDVRTDDPRPPLLLDVPGPDGRPRRVELSGTLMPRLTGADASVSATRKTNEGPPDRWRFLVPHLLEHVLLSAAGDVGPRRAAVCSLSKAGPMLDTADLKPLTAESARALLVTLCADLIAGPYTSLFPIEAVTRWKFGSTRNGPREWDDDVEALIDQMEEGRNFACAGPVPRPFEYPPVDADLAERLYDRRFAPLFALVDAPAAAPAPPPDDAPKAPKATKRASKSKGGA